MTPYVLDTSIYTPWTDRCPKVKHKMASQDHRRSPGQVSANLPKNLPKGQIRKKYLDENEGQELGSEYRQVIKLFEEKLYYETQMDLVRAAAAEKIASRNTVLKRLKFLVAKGVIVEVDVGRESPGYCLKKDLDRVLAMIDHRGDVDLDQEMRDAIRDILSKIRNLHQDQAGAMANSEFMMEEREVTMLRTCENLVGEFNGYWWATSGSAEMPATPPSIRYQNKMLRWEHDRRGARPTKPTLMDWAEYWRIVLHYITPVKKRP